MKNGFIVLLAFVFALVGMAGCAPSTSSPISNTLSNPNAAYTANVSQLYYVAAYGTVGSWSGIDLKWKDSAGIIRALSSYAGKPVLLSFWVTDLEGGAWQEPTFDSVQTDLGDSVRIVTIAENYDSLNNFQVVYNYVKAHSIRSQVLVDSNQFVHIEYSELANGSLAVPETFVLRPNGTILTFLFGYETKPILDSLVRASYVH